MALTETFHAGEFILSEANGNRSREEIVVLSGENLCAGAVLGKVGVESAEVTGAADAGNTGGGAIGTLSAGAGARAGEYRAVCIEPAAGGGVFSVEDPDGVQIGRAAVGVEFSGEVAFTITDGDPDFAAGDAFTITVAAGVRKYREYNPANNDGSQTPAAVLYDAVDATGGDAPGVAIVRDAEVKEGLLQWFSGATEDQKSAGAALLAEAGIIARSE